MTHLDKLARKMEHPDFAKAYVRNKVKTVEDTIGRPLAAHEQEAVKSLSHANLKKVVTGLRPRGKTPHPPE